MTGNANEVCGVREAGHIQEESSGVANPRKSYWHTANSRILSNADKCRSPENRADGARGTSASKVFSEVIGNLILRIHTESGVDRAEGQTLSPYPIVCLGGDLGCLLEFLCALLSSDH